MIIKILEKINNSSGLTGVLIKYCLRFLDRIFHFKFSFLVRTNSTLRPSYSYCLYHAAVLAKKLNYKSFSAIEFGVATGRGLLFLEEIAEKISHEVGIKIEIYGFDLGSGLTEPADYKDLNYYFQSGFYKMDVELLKKNLKVTKLFIGDVKNTINDFLNEDHAPIGAIFNDLDYYSSTMNSFKIFDNVNLEKYLPRVFLYFDDIVGTELEMYNEYTGELLAIKNFNLNNLNKKICLNQNLISKSNENWKYQIYYLHIFNHKDYIKFIAKKEQETMITQMRLKISD